MRVIVLVSILVSCFFFFVYGGSTSVTRYMIENPELVPGPYKGAMYSWNPSHIASGYPGTIAYIRFDWKTLEPTDGGFSFGVIENYITEKQSQGFEKLAFRVMCSNPSLVSWYSSPEWLFDSGCESYQYIMKVDTGIAPVYSDSLFLYYHSRFLDTLAKKYDGDPRIEYIDIGSIGWWGEGYTPQSISHETEKQIVDMYTENFRETKLMSPSLVVTKALFEYGLQQGLGFHHDGCGQMADIGRWDTLYVGNRDFSDTYCQKWTIWQTQPIACEFFTSWPGFVSNPLASLDTAILFMEKNHTTYVIDLVGVIGDSATNQKVQNLYKKIGYNFVMCSITHDSVVGDSGVSMVWTNVGLAPIYRDLSVSIVCSLPCTTCYVSTVDFPKIFPGDTVVVDLDFPDMPNGHYRVGVGLADKITDEKIPLQIMSPANNFLYDVSAVEVKG